MTKCPRCGTRVVLARKPRLCRDCKTDLRNLRIMREADRKKNMKARYDKGLQ